MTHVEEVKAEGRAAQDRHLREQHGIEYGPEWRSRVPNGFGYEFAEWHEELHRREDRREALTDALLRKVHRIWHEARSLEPCADLACPHGWAP